MRTAAANCRYNALVSPLAMLPLLLGPLASLATQALALTPSPNASDRPDLLRDAAGNLSLPDNATFSPVPVFDNLGLAKVSVFFLMFAFCIIANVYMLNLIRRMRRHRSVMNQLLVHLCVADLLVATFNMFGEAVWIITVQWRAGVVECKLFKFAQPFSVTLSTCLVVLIGVDRASVILCPIQRPLHERLVKHYIGGVYILSIIVNLPQVSSAPTCNKGGELSVNAILPSNYRHVKERKTLNEVHFQL